MKDVSEEVREGTKAIREADPTGRSSKEPGAKLDAGKVRMGLVLGGFANALTEVAKVGTNGAAKYSDNGWKQVPNAEARYTDALLRHVFKHMRGEEIDPEWGLPHLAHAAWGCLAVLEKMLERQKADQTLPEGTTFENGFAIVPNENPLRFKLIPESLPLGTTVTIKRPIGGSPEQAAPLKEFTPMNPDPSSKLGRYKSDPVTVEEFRFKKSVAKRLMKEGGENNMATKKGAKCAMKSGAVKAPVMKKAMAKGAKPAMKK